MKEQKQSSKVTFHPLIYLIVLLGLFVVALEERVECLEVLIAQLKQQHKDYIVNLIREQEVTMNDFTLNLENRHLDEVLEGIIGLVRSYFASVMCNTLVPYFPKYSDTLISYHSYPNKESTKMGLQCWDGMANSVDPDLKEQLDLGLNCLLSLSVWIFR